MPKGNDHPQKSEQKVKHIQKPELDAEREYWILKQKAESGLIIKNLIATKKEEDQLKRNCLQ